MSFYAGAQDDLTAVAGSEDGTNAIMVVISAIVGPHFLESSSPRFGGLIGLPGLIIRAFLGEVVVLEGFTSLRVVETIGADLVVLGDQTLF